MKATLESQMSFCLSICPVSKPLSLSELLLSTIEPINHQAYGAYRPLSLSTIEPTCIVAIKSEKWSKLQTIYIGIEDVCRIAKA